MSCPFDYHSGVASESLLNVIDLDVHGGCCVFACKSLTIIT